METKQEMDLDISPKECVLLSNLYINKNYPFGSLTIEEVSEVLKVSHATVINMIKKLEKQGYIRKIRDYLVFIYPVENNNIRRGILKKMGFFRE